MAIHNAVLDGGDRDAYTGEKLDWFLISTYDNEKNKEQGAALRRDSPCSPPSTTLATSQGAPISGSLAGAPMTQKVSSIWPTS